MTILHETNLKIKEPSKAFQQLCNYIAVSQTRNSEETLRELILRALFSFEGEKASTANEVSNILETIYGIDLLEQDIQEALDQLIATGDVLQPIGTHYVLSATNRNLIQNSIDKAAQRQTKVKDNWKKELNEYQPALECESTWLALQEYLAKAFRRHGIQVALFLDPSAELPAVYSESLTSILNEVINKIFEPATRESAKKAVINFMANLTKDTDRILYVSECANGAANYYSLKVPPEVSAQVRKRIEPFVLFCDTNYLFGVLDLHVGSFLEVSNKLLEVIGKLNLPIKVRYHERTLNELRASINNSGEKLKRNTWSQSLSRAAISSRNISGMELKYHQKNAIRKIDVDTFLMPYQHVDVLLKDKGIDIFRGGDSNLENRATIEAEYKEFLQKQGIEKSDDKIQHDAAVLECVHSLRRDVKSTLSAGALLVTCDYRLFRYDAEASVKNKIISSTVLPNILWQVLKPYISSADNYDRSFAETFSIPEFRTIGSDASEVCSRMLGILATYREFPEETAIKLLSNDMLIDRLRAIRDDQQFKEQVDAAIAIENQDLLEQRDTLLHRLKALENEKSQDKKEWAKQKEHTSTEIEEIRKQLLEKEKENKALEASHNEKASKVQNYSTKLKELESAKNAAEDLAKKEAKRSGKAEEEKDLQSAKDRLVTVAIITIIILSALTWLSNNYGEGKNFFLKVLSFWRYYTAAVSLCMLAGYFYLGKRRFLILKDKYWFK